MKDGQSVFQGLLKIADPDNEEPLQTSSGSFVVNDDHGAGKPGP